MPLLSLLPFFALAVAATDSVEGRWQTIDDETGEPKAVVEIRVDDGRLIGHIVQLFPKDGEDPNPVCDKCKGERHNQPVLGMQIIDGLRIKDDRWTDGKILDPEKGKLYSCQLWREGDVLRVRGTLLIFHRTQTWIRLPPPQNPQTPAASMEASSPP